MVRGWLRSSSSSRETGEDERRYSCDRQVIVLPAYGFGHGGEGDDSEARKNSQGRDLMDANVKATVSGGRLVDMMLKFKGCTCL